MEVYFNADKNIDSKERVEAYFKKVIKEELSHYENRVTRVEIHLSDENAGKAGAKDKRCVLEARPNGLKPVAVTGSGDTVEKAISDASKKMTSSLSKLIGKLSKIKQ